jgi:ABC-type glycerol-3-phosphate transport system substrate-binding protein
MSSFSNLTMTILTMPDRWASTARLEGGGVSCLCWDGRTDRDSPRLQRSQHRVRRWAFAVLFLCGCRPRSETLTAALALLPGELPAYRSVVADFERDSGIEVVVVPQQYADIRRALRAEALAGSGTLDLVELDVYTLAHAARDVALLDDMVAPADLADLQSRAVAAGRIDGLRFLPHRLAWQALLYNQAVLGKPPATWAELLAVAREHSGRIGFKGALYEGLTCDLLPFVWSAGGTGENLDDRGARAAFDLFSELAPHLHPQSATFKEASIVEAMARGEIVLELNWPFAMSMLGGEGLAPVPFRSAPLPAGAEGVATVLGGGYLAVPRASAHRAEAARLALYLLGSHAQSRLVRELGWFSPRRDVPLAAGSDLYAGFAALRDEVRARPERPDYPRLSRLWQEAFRAVAFDRQSPADVLPAAQRRFEESNR